MENEIWKDVVGYEGLYQVSNLGRMKTFQKNKCALMKLLNDGNGYLYVGLCKNKIRKSVKIHKIVASAFLNHIPSGYNEVVDHINDNPLDNRVENLQLITQRENAYKTQGKYSSKYKGVSFISKHNKWMATIYIDKKNKNLGLFHNEYDAHMAYQSKLNQLNKL